MGRERLMAFLLSARGFRSLYLSECASNGIGLGIF